MADEGNEEGERDNTNGEEQFPDLDDFDLDDIEIQAAAKAEKELAKDMKIAALALNLVEEVQKTSHWPGAVDDLTRKTKYFVNLKKLISTCPCKAEQKQKALDGLGALASCQASKNSRTHQSDQIHQSDNVKQLADAVSVFAGVKLMGETADKVSTRAAQ